MVRLRRQRERAAIINGPCKEIGLISFLFGCVSQLMIEVVGSVSWGQVLFECKKCVVFI